MTERITNQISAPGRFMLFGDYAVYFGEPAIALAIDMKTSCTALLSSKFTVNGADLDPLEHAHIRGALLQAWSDMDRPLEFRIDTTIKDKWGLGESASTIVSCLGAISMLHNHMIFEDLARNAFDVERELLVEASPIDTSAAVYGGCISKSKEPSDGLLWSIGQGTKWHIHHLDVKDVGFVIGKVDIGFSAKDLFSKIKRFHNRNAFARDIVREIGDISKEGTGALRNGNIDRVGELMNLNQKALVTLGASHPTIEKVIREARRHSFGAKMTGDANGHCVVALTDVPERVIEVFEKAGGQAYQVQIPTEGVGLEEKGAIFVK